MLLHWPLMGGCEVSDSPATQNHVVPVQQEQKESTSPDVSVNTTELAGVSHWGEKPSPELVKNILQSLNNEEATQAVRRRIQSEVFDKFPLGLSHAQVEHRLESRWMESLYYSPEDLQDTKWPTIRKIHQSIRDQGFKPSEVNGVIISYPGPEFQRVYPVLATLLFFFGKQDRLIHKGMENISFFFSFRQVSGKPTDDQVRASIAHHLPKGSSPEAVKKWLRSHRIGYDSLDRQKDFQHSSYVRDAGIDPKRLGRIITGIIPFTVIGPTRRMDITLAFFFDREGKLIDSLVQEVGTGI
ncbi:MAG: hypothetical protein KY468_03070 [Armatimonadetes bacterium]|nr:hypothetical protein [Armatimonadota bacterium]